MIGVVHFLMSLLSSYTTQFFFIYLFIYFFLLNSSVQTGDLSQRRRPVFETSRAVFYCIKTSSIHTHMSERSSSFPTLLLRSHRNRFGTRYVRDLSIFQLFYLIINETSTWNLFWLTAYDESHIFFFKLLDGLVFCRHLVWLNTYQVPEMITRSIQTKNGPCFFKKQKHSNWRNVFFLSSLKFNKEFPYES